jgi:chaperonin GroEL
MDSFLLYFTNIVQVKSSQKGSKCMVKGFKSSEDARTALANGIHEVYRLLSGTFGPYGCSAIMEDENGNLLLSAQTYSMLRNLKSKDLFVDEGMQMAKEAALNTQRLVGDGSVMTLLFINDMIDRGRHMIAAGVNPVIMSRGLKKAFPVVQKKVIEMAEPFSKENLLPILRYELAEENLAQIIFDAYDKLGMEGIVIVKEGHGLVTELEYQEGFEIASGYLSEKMCLDMQDNRKIIKQPYILIVDQVINKFTTLLPVLEQIVAEKAGLVIVAEDIQGEALTLLVHNIQKKVFDAAVIKAHGIGRWKTDLLEDLAVVTGGYVIGNQNPITVENVKLTDLGRACEVRIEKNKTLFLEGRGNRDSITKRIEKIIEYINANETEFMNKIQYRERIGNLTGKVAVIRVGSPSLVQMHEETHRIQSALSFVRAVINGGVLPGGGSALVSISEKLRDSLPDHTTMQEEYAGRLLLFQAIKAPAITFIRKEGLGEKESLEIMSNSAGQIGYNAVTHEFTDMRIAGIYDSASVIVTALNQAVSVVYEWLNTEVLMVNVAPDQEDIELMKKGVPIMR